MNKFNNAIAAKVKKRSRLNYILLALIFGFLTAISLIAGFSYTHAFSGGSGTEANPYLISTKEHFAAIDTTANIGANKYFKVINNIDISGLNPIGTSTGGAFKGHIDGGGYALTGFSVADGAMATDNIGFIKTMNAGSLKNIFLDNVSIGNTGKSNVGGLVGRITGAVNINNCSVQGSIDAANTDGGGDNVGGLFGYISAAATIKEVCFNGRVSGKNNVGGVVGQLASATITDSFAVATVNAFQFTPGQPTGTGYAGGYVGYANSGKVVTSYTSSRVSSMGGRSYVGTFTGRQGNTTYQNCYFNTYMHESTAEGHAANITHTYSTSTFLWSAGGTLPGVTGLTDANLRLFASTTSNFDTVNVWRRNYGYNNDYPLLSKNAYFAPSFAGGAGTKSDPYVIRTAHQFQNLAFYVQNSPFTDYYFELGNDITLTGEWTPIGSATGYFRSHFDGKNHTVSGMRITLPNTRIGLFGLISNGAEVKNVVLREPYIKLDMMYSQPRSDGNYSYMTVHVGAMLGAMAANTVVENCHVVGGTVDVTPDVATFPASNYYIYTGGFIGYCINAAISDCSSSADVTAGRFNKYVYVGGFGGYLTVGQVSRCEATGSVHLDNPTTSSNHGGYAGGFAGIMYGTINDIYVSADITTETSMAINQIVGGIVGQMASNDKLQITNAIFCGSINVTAKSTATLYVGGITGYMNGSSYRMTLENCIMAGSITVNRTSTAALRYGNMATSNLSNTNANRAYHSVKNSLVLDTHSLVLTGTQTAAVTTYSRVATGTVSAAELQVFETYENLGFNAAAWKIDGATARLKMDGTDMIAGYFDGGAGTISDPYRIATADQLQSLQYFLGPKYTDTYYIITHDIDLAGYDWLPIGSGVAESENSYAFAGHIDGNGKTISNMNISMATATQVSYQYYGIGLIGSMYNASIIDLTIKNPVINVYSSGTVTKYVGGLVGTAYFSSIDNCAVIHDTPTAAVYNKAVRTVYAGGLVGYIVYSSITDSHATVPVTAMSTSGNYAAIAGGLVGYSTQTHIERSYAAGNVSVTENHANHASTQTAAGGLVGYSSNGSATDCYALGDVSLTGKGTAVTINQAAGGLVGFSTGNAAYVDRCYATGDISITAASGNVYAGGLMGYVNTAVAITRNSVAANGRITATTAKGGDVNVGSVGGNQYVTTTAVAYSNIAYNMDMDITITSGGVGGNGFSLDELKQSTQYEKSTDNFGLGWDFADVWEWNAGVNGGLPTLIGVESDYGGIADSFAGGKGTKGDPFQISNEAQLRAVGNYLGPKYQGVYFKLTNDIVLTAEWAPIGEEPYTLVSTFPLNTTYAFMGNFDGGGYTIDGLRVSGNYTSAGLFAVTYYANIKNLVIDNYEYDVTDAYNTMVMHGGLIGYSYRTTVNNVRIIGGTLKASTHMYEYAGGLIGYASYTEIENCSADGVKIFASGLQSGSSVGGLVGFFTNNTLIDKCYADASIELTSYSTAYAGGLVGRGAGNAKAFNSYSRGKIDVQGAGNFYVGGITGYISPSMIAKCYSSVDISAIAPGTLYAGSIAGQSLGGSSISDSIGLSSYIDVSTPGARSVAPVGGGTLMSSEGNIYYIDSMQIDSSGVGMGGTAVPRSSITEENLTKTALQGGFDVRWDFDNIWAIDENKNGGLPYLIGTDVFDSTTCTPAQLEQFLHLPAMSEVTINDKGENEGVTTDFGLVAKQQFVQDIIAARNAASPGSGAPFDYLLTEINQLLDRVILVNTANGAFAELSYAYYGRAVTAGNENVLMSLRNKLSALLAEFGRDEELASDLEVIRTNLSVSQRDLVISWIETLHSEISTLAMEGMDGNGLKSNPFKITNQYELMSLTQCLGQEFEDTYWVIENNITLSGEWVPIGTGSAANAFWGHVDGRGYTISGLKITDKTYNYAGLFGYVTGAELTDIIVASPEINTPGIYGISHAGALAAYISGDAIISGCHSTLGSISVSSQTTQYVGGLIGYAGNSIITNSSSTTAVNVHQYNYTGGACYVGGLIGYSGTSTVSMCYAGGNVTAKSDGKAGYTVAGGLIGAVTGETTDCYATGNVYAERTYMYDSGVNAVMAGGVVGFVNSAASVTNRCYATGSVTAKGVRQVAFAGGVAGGVSSSATVQNCLALNSSVQATTGYNRKYVGHVAANTTWSSGAGNKAAAIDVTLINNYYLDTTSITMSGDPGDAVDTSQEKVYVYFAQPSNYVNIFNWDMDGTWEIPPAGNLPVLRDPAEMRPEDYYDYDEASPGTAGQESNPFLINNAEQLSRLRSFTGVEYKGVYWKQNANIALTGSWTPIGSGTGVLSFYGNFNGNGFSISGLSVTDRYYAAGLFGYLLYSQITNVTLQSPQVNQSYDQTLTTHIGTLVGYGNSIIVDNCRVIGGTVNSDNDRITYTGGLIGYATATKVTGSTTEGTIVTGRATSDLSDRSFGGLIGASSNVIIERCSSSATVRAQNNETSAVLGGITGFFTGEMRDSYSTGSVSTTGTNNTGTVYAGGLAGVFNGRSLVENCYSTSAIAVATEGSAIPTLTNTGISAVGGLVGGLRVTTAVYLAEIRNSVAANTAISITGASAYSINYIMGNKTNRSSNTVSVTVIEGGTNYRSADISLSPGVLGTGVSGSSKPISDLKSQSTYTGIGWNFSNIWRLLTPGQSFPVFRTSTIADYFGGGSGTQVDPFIITTAAHLANLRYFTGVPFANTYWRMDADIALTGEWTPIGSGSGAYAFNGNLDGNGKRVTGLRISQLTSGNYTYAGLFGYTERAEIQNLTIVSPNIEHIGTTTIAIYTGGLVGAGATNSSIFNCAVVGGSIKVTNNTSAQTGGLVGSYASSTIDLCSSTASVQVVLTAGGTAYSGGFAGNLSQSTVERCYSTGSTNVSTGGNATLCAGGFAGFTPKQMNDCYSTGSVIATSAGTGWQYLGALVGYSTISSTIDSCYTSSNITATSSNDQSVVYAAGILGRTTKTTLTIKNCAVMTTSVNINSQGYYAGHILGYHYATDLINNVYSTAMTFRQNGNITSPTSFSGTGTAKAPSLFDAQDIYFDSVEGGGLGWNTSRIWKFDSLTNRPVHKAADEYDIYNATPAQLEAMFNLPDPARVTQEDRGSWLNPDSLTYKHLIASRRYESATTEGDKAGFLALVTKIDDLLGIISTVSSDYQSVYGTYLENYDGITNVSQVGDESSGMTKNKADLSALLTRYPGNLAAYQVENINNAVDKITADIALLVQLGSKFDEAKELFDVIDWSSVKTTNIGALTSLSALYEELIYPSNYMRFADGDKAVISSNNATVLGKIEELRASVTNFNNLIGGTSMPTPGNVKSTDQTSGSFYAGGSGGLNALRVFMQSNFFTNTQYDTVRPEFGAADEQKILEMYSALTALLAKIAEVNNSQNGYDYFVNTASVAPRLIESTDKISDYTIKRNELSTFYASYAVSADNLTAAQKNNITNWTEAYAQAVQVLTDVAGEYNTINSGYEAMLAAYGGSGLPSAQTGQEGELMQISVLASDLQDKIEFAYLTPSESDKIDQIYDVTAAIVVQLEDLTARRTYIADALPGVTVNTVKSVDYEDVEALIAKVAEIEALPYYASRMETEYKTAVTSRGSLASALKARLDAYLSALGMLYDQKDDLLTYTSVQLDTLQSELDTLTSTYDEGGASNMTASEKSDMRIIGYDIQFARVVIIYDETDMDVLANRYLTIDSQRIKIAEKKDLYDNLWTAEQLLQVNARMDELTALGAKLKEYNRLRILFSSALDMIDSSGGNRTGALLASLPKYTSGLIDLIDDLSIFVSQPDYALRFSTEEKNTLSTVLTNAHLLRDEVEAPAGMIEMLKNMYDKLTPYRVNYEKYIDLTGWLEYFMDNHWDASEDDIKDEYNALLSSVQLDMRLIGTEIRNSFMTIYRVPGVSEVKTSDTGAIRACYNEAQRILTEYSDNVPAGYTVLTATYRAEIEAIRDLCSGYAGGAGEPDGALKVRLEEYMAELTVLINAPLAAYTTAELNAYDNLISEFLTKYNVNSSNMTSQEISTITTLRYDSQFHKVRNTFESIDFANIKANEVPQVTSVLNEIIFAHNFQSVFWTEEQNLMITQENTGFIARLTALAAKLNDINNEYRRFTSAIPASMDETSVTFIDLVSLEGYAGGLTALSADIGLYLSDPAPDAQRHRLTETELMALAEVKSRADILIAALGDISAIIQAIAIDEAAITEQTADDFAALKEIYNRLCALYGSYGDRFSDAEKEEIDLIYNNVCAKIQQTVVAMHSGLPTVQTVKNSDVAAIAEAYADALYVMTLFSSSCVSGDFEYCSNSNNNSGWEVVTDDEGGEIARALDPEDIEESVSQLLALTAPASENGILLSRLATYNAIYESIIVTDYTSLAPTEMIAFVNDINILFINYNNTPNFNMMPDEIEAVSAILADAQYYYAVAIYENINTGTITGSQVDDVLETANRMNSIKDEFSEGWTDEMIELIDEYVSELMTIVERLTVFNIEKDNLLGAIPEALTLKNVKLEQLDEDGYDTVNDIEYPGGVWQIYTDARNWLATDAIRNQLDELEIAKFESMIELALALHTRMYLIENTILDAETLIDEVEQSGIAESYYAGLSSAKSALTSIKTLYAYESGENDNITDAQLARINAALETIEILLTDIAVKAYNDNDAAYGYLLLITDMTVTTDNIPDINNAYAEAVRLLAAYTGRLNAAQRDKLAALRDLCASGGTLLTRINGYIAAVDAFADDILPEAMAAMGIGELDALKTQISDVLSEYNSAQYKNMTTAEINEINRALYDIEYYRAVNIYSAIDIANIYAKDIDDSITAYNQISALLQLYGSLWTTQQAEKVGEFADELSALNTLLSSTNTKFAQITGALTGLDTAYMNYDHLSSLDNYAGGLNALVADIAALKASAAYDRLTGEQQLAVDAVLTTASGHIDYLTGIEAELAALEAAYTGLDSDDYAGFNALLADVRAFVAAYVSENNDNLSGSQKLRTSTLSDMIEAAMMDVVDDMVDDFISSLSLPALSSVKTTDKTTIAQAIAGLENLDDKFSEVLTEAHLLRLAEVRELCNRLNARIAAFEAAYAPIIAAEAGYDTLDLDGIYAALADIYALLGEYNSTGEPPTNNMTPAQITAINALTAELKFRELEARFAAIDFNMTIGGLDAYSIEAAALHAIRNEYSSAWKVYQNGLASQRLSAVDALEGALIAAKTAYDGVIDVIDDDWQPETITAAERELLEQLAVRITAIQTDAAMFARLSAAQQTEIGEIKARAIELLGGIDEIKLLIEALEYDYAQITGNDYTALKSIYDRADGLLAEHDDKLMDGEKLRLAAIKTEIVDTVNTAAEALPTTTLPGIDTVNSGNMAALTALAHEAALIEAEFINQLTVENAAALATFAGNLEAITLYLTDCMSAYQAAVGADLPAMTTAQLKAHDQSITELLAKYNSGGKQNLTADELLVISNFTFRVKMAIFDSIYSGIDQAGITAGEADDLDAAITEIKLLFDTYSTGWTSAERTLAARRIAELETLHTLLTDTLSAYEGIIGAIDPDLDETTVTFAHKAVLMQLAADALALEGNAAMYARLTAEEQGKVTALKQKAHELLALLKITEDAIDALVAAYGAAQPGDYEALRDAAAMSANIRASYASQLTTNETDILDGIEDGIEQTAITAVMALKLRADALPGIMTVKLASREAIISCYDEAALLMSCFGGGVLPQAQLDILNEIADKTGADGALMLHLDAYAAFLLAAEELSSAGVGSKTISELTQAASSIADNLSLYHETNDNMTDEEYAAINSLLADINAAILSHSDLTDRIDQLDALIGGLTEADYTKYSLDNLKAALAAAKLIAAGDLPAARYMDALSALAGIENSLVSIKNLRGSVDEFTLTIVPNKDFYTPGSWAVFESALASANSALNLAAGGTALTQDAVDGIRSQLLSAKDALVFTDNLPALLQLIEDARAIDGSNYLKVTYDVLTDYLDILDGLVLDELTPEQLLEHIEALQARMNALVDITSINQLIAVAEMINTNAYTPASVSVFAVALNAAKSELLSDEATATTVALRESVLQSAINGLVPISPDDSDIFVLVPGAPFIFTDGDYKLIDRSTYVYNGSVTIYLMNIADNEKIARVLAQFTNNMANIKVFAGGVEIDPASYITANIGTGMIINLYDDDGVIIDSVTVVIKGDISGDGAVNIVDKFLFESHIKGGAQLTGVAFMAADINRDKAVNIMDKFLFTAKLNGTADFNAEYRLTAGLMAAKENTFVSKYMPSAPPAVAEEQPVAAHTAVEEESEPMPLAGDNFGTSPAHEDAGIDITAFSYVPEKYSKRRYYI